MINFKQHMILSKDNGEFTEALRKLESPLESQVRTGKQPRWMEPKSRAITCMVAHATAELAAKPCAVTGAAITPVPGHQPFVLLPLLPELIPLCPCFFLSLAPSTKVRTDACD